MYRAWRPVPRTILRALNILIYGTLSTTGEEHHLKHGNRQKMSERSFSAVLE